MTPELAAELLAMANRLREIHDLLPGNLEKDWAQVAREHIDDILVLNQQACSCCGEDGWKESGDDVAHE